MSVYVGLAFTCSYSAKWPYIKAAHLVADTVEELKNFAVNKLHLQPEWYQPKSTPHFDLSESKRKIAIQCGAIPFKSLREEGEWLIKRNYSNKIRPKK